LCEQSVGLFEGGYRLITTAQPNSPVRRAHVHLGTDIDRGEPVHSTARLPALRYLDGEGMLEWIRECRIDRCCWAPTSARTRAGEGEGLEYSYQRRSVLGEGGGRRRDGVEHPAVAVDRAHD